MLKKRFLTIASVPALLLFLLLLAPATQPVAAEESAEIVAFDLVNSTNQNLTSFVNNAPTFGSAGDCFGILQRPDGPFAVLDDSLSIFTPDTGGIIGEANLDQYFCIVDTINGDNPAGSASATWTFDVSGFENLELAVDIGAMGDFESNDFFTIEVSVDGGTPETLFASTVDEDSSQDYTMDSGTLVTLSDPMLLDGTLLNNTLQTFAKAISGSGSELTVTLTGQGDGGSEAVAMQNIVVSGTPVVTGPQVIAFDLVNSTSQNLTSFVNNAPTFGSAGDCFGILQRPDGPFAVLDDSLSIFTPDTGGIIGEANLDQYFCIVDTVNGDNPAGSASATWTFDVSGFENLELAVDIGAMGDFESSDFFTIEVAVDGGTPETLFASTVDEDGSLEYTMDSGTLVTLSDPMLLDGTLLNNTLQTFAKAISGSGSELTVTLTGQGDGGSEAVAMQNLIISGTGGGGGGPAADTVAFDLVNSTNQNLTSFVNNAPTFGSAGDCFGILQRPDGPFAVLDDSLSIFTPDTGGIIGEANLDQYFCIVDTINGDNPAGTASATWTFDVSGFDNLELAVDIGAMGDFESNDFFTIEVAVDGGTPETLFASIVDEDGSQEYTMDSGTLVTLSDPMLLDGTLLNNTLQTFSKTITDSGSELTVTLTAQGDGGSEAVAMQNLIITGTPAGPRVVAFDMVGSANEGLISFVNNAPVFGSAGDCFGILQRPAGPFAVLDDSLSIFTPDTGGIIGEANLDQYFCIVDTVNGDNPAGSASATWTFDIDGVEDLALSIDIGAMGDFESSDFFTMEVSIDGAPAQLLFASTVDEDGSLEYTMDSGTLVTLNDPMLLDGTLLNNTLQTFSKAISGTGSELAVTLTAQGDGGSEAVAMQNLIITGVGGGNGGGDPVDPLTCEGTFDLTFIHTIQGAGAATPLDGSVVIIEGIVVGDFQANDGDGTNLAGFYVQEEDQDVDSDPLTSEGIFVFDPNTLVDVNEGDLVRVKGLVSEFQEQTQITASEVVECGGGFSVTPTTISFPLPTGQSDLEAYEGMAVRVDEPMTVIEYFNLDRYGIVDVATERLEQPTDVADPGPAALAVQAENDRKRIRLDDGNQAQNPFPITLPDGQLEYADSFGGGDTLENIEGVMSWIRPRVGGDPEGYAIQLTSLPDFTDTNPRDAAPDVGGSLKIVSFNVLNYFTTLGSRGADTPAEFEKQTDKIVAALLELDADIVGLIEIENNYADGTFSAIATLVDELNAVAGTNTYAYIDPGSNVGTDQIAVGFIYKPATVAPFGDVAILDSSVDPLFLDTKNRPVVIQTFDEIATGERLTVAVNHFKSKGSDCDDVGDPNANDGSGNCNGTRTDAAIALASFLATDPTGSGDPDFLIIGDLNSYAQEDPIDALEAAGYVDLMDLFNDDDVYGYVFSGQTGYLDYGMASPSLVEQVTDTKPWTINSDEPDAYQYEEDFDDPNNLPLWYAPTPYRYSDHDPVVMGFALESGPQVVDFQLVDADSDTIVGPLTDGMVIDLAVTPEINVIAVTTPDVVGSVAFEINGEAFRVENETPYSLAGNRGGNFNALPMVPGSYTVAATAFTGADATGDSGATKTISVTVINSAASSVTGFVLVDADTGSVIGPVNDGDTIVLSNYGAINLVAETTAGVESVVFAINGDVMRIENVAPYAIAGDSDGEFNSWTIEPGVYTITAQPFGGNNGRGLAGNPLTITVTIVE